MPRLTVITAVKNGEPFLARTIKSILAQDFSDFHYVVVNDGSDDGTAHTLGGFADPRLEVVHLPASVGVAEARNRGLELARGEYVALSDADDLSLPGRFAAQVDFLDRHPGHVLVGAAHSVIDQHDITVGHHRPATDPTRIRFHMILSNCFAHSAGMFRREAAQRLGLRYDRRLPPSEDYDFFARLCEAGPTTNLATELMAYRVHSQQATQARRAVQEKNAAIIRRQNLERLGLTLDDAGRDRLNELYHQPPARLAPGDLGLLLVLYRCLEALARVPWLDRAVLTDLGRIWAGRIMAAGGWAAWPRLAAAAPAAALWWLARGRARKDGAA